MESVTRFVERRLKLRVNADKSALAPALERPLLGLQFLRAGDGAVRVTVAPKADGRAKDRLRRLTTRNWGVSRERRIREINRFTVEWTAYFCFADTLSLFGGSTSGFAAGCGRCAGRSGSAHKRAARRRLGRSGASAARRAGRAVAGVLDQPVGLDSHEPHLELHLAAKHAQDEACSVAGLGPAARRGDAHQAREGLSAPSAAST
jgi:Group II intron, maturase-specific domain